MRCATIISAVFVLTTTAATVASPPYCVRSTTNPTGWAKEVLENGDTVFLGTVLSKKAAPQKEPDDPEPEAASSMAELIQRIEEGQYRDAKHYDQVISFEVLKDWKEPIYPIAGTKVNTTSRRYTTQFEKGAMYLVVGRDLEGSLYWIRDQCWDAIPADSAVKLIEALNDLTATP